MPSVAYISRCAAIAGVALTVGLVVLADPSADITNIANADTIGTEPKQDEQDEQDEQDDQDQDQDDRDGGDVPNKRNELVESSTAIWNRLSSMLSTRSSDEISEELAARVFQLSAQIAPGFSLPSMAKVAVPTFDTLPVTKSVLTSQFGYRRDPINGNGKHHSGLDFSAKTGTAVRAVGTGLVVKAERMGGYGRIIFIDHGAGFITRYAHLNSITVSEGEQVNTGERIGTVGSSGRVTGPHLHFEVRVLGQPIDPAPFLGLKARGFGQRLRDLLTLLGKTKPGKSKKRERKRRSHRRG